MHPLLHPLLRGRNLVATASLLLLTGCAATSVDTTAPNAGSEVMTTAAPLAHACTGVEVSVDFGVLDAPAIDTCVDVTATTSAVDVLSAAGVTVAGTDEYGSAVLCRVNGLPSADVPITVSGHDPYTETCASMPPEFAYWDIWLKQGDGDWAYAMVGKNEITVSPGDSIGLVFNTGTSTPAPQ